MADKRVKYIADDGPFCEVGITGKQTSWRRNQSGFVTEANAILLIASGKFVLSSTAFATDSDGLDSHLAEHSAMGAALGSAAVTYDAQGRVATHDQWTMTYDATTGRASSQTNGVKTQTFSYDSAGRYTGYVES